MRFLLLYLLIFMFALPAHALVVRDGNSTITPLTASSTFTGIGEKIASDDWKFYNWNRKSESISVSVTTDQDGTLFMEFSNDNVNWDKSLAFTIIANVTATNRTTSVAKYYRTRFTNTSFNPQTFLRLQTLMGESYSPPKNAMLEMSKGTIGGHTLVTFFGHHPLVGMVEETIWPCESLFSFPSGASTMTISSDDANDTSAGTGLRSILILGLGPNFFPQSEVVVTNGLSAVTTVNQYIRINTLVGLTAGSGGKNAGKVFIGIGTVTAGKPATVFNCVAEGANLNETAFYTIPAGKSGYVIQALYDGEANKDLVLNAYLRTPPGLFLRVAAFNLSSASAALLPLTPPSRMLGKTDIEYRGFIDVQTGDIKTAVTLAIVDD